MSDHPDFFADGYSVTVGPFGLLLTFLRSNAVDATGQPIEGNEIVGRARMSKDLAEHMLGQIRSILDQAEKGGMAPTTGKSH